MLSDKAVCPSLCKRFGKERLEAACERAMFIKGIGYASITSILNNNLDQKPLTQVPPYDLRYRNYFVPESKHHFLSV